EELEQIGKQYFRGKTAKGIKGIGMGISLTQRIIREHGAKLIFTSEVGKGTTATILFMT
ncbi:MAG: sensor histidine kinase, partial [Magnetococcales bacterium]|nr:sensor histidine kinase [Magnetococcales bacterium]